MRYKIFKDDDLVNIIVADEDFCAAYCERNGYTYEVDVIDETPKEAAPSKLDIIEAQVTYTAMMTNTLIS